MDNISAVIQIESIVPSDYGVKINAQDKKVYNVSKTKKDGSTSVAWEQLTHMGLKGTDPLTGELGSIVEIWFREVPNSHGGVSRYIASFKETNGTPTQTPASAPKPRTGDSVASQSQSRNFEKEAYEKCCSIWAQGITLESALGHLERGDFWNLFQAIKADGEKRFNTWNQLGEKLKPKEVVAEDIQEMATEMEAEDDLPF